MQAVEEFAAGKGLKVEYFSDGDRRAPEGYINGDTVYINMASDAPIVGVAVHEVGHRLKGGNIKRWNRYARSVSRLMSTNRELAGYAEQVRDSYTDPDSVRYSSVLDENGNIDRAKVDEEVILKVTQEILKRTADGDTDFLRQIAADRSLIDRLLDFIRGIKNSITIKLTGSEMAMLDEAERNLVNLMRGESKDFNVSDVKFDLLNGTGSKKGIFIEQIEKARNGELFEETHLVVSNKTPKFYETFGLNTELPLLITKKHALDITTAEDGIHDNYHGITDSQLKSAIKSMAEPALVFESATQPGRLVVVTTVVDDKRRPIIMAIKPNARGNINTLECDTNLIASLYGKDSFIKFFIKNITNDNLLYYNKEKSRLLSNTPGVQFPNNIPHVDFNKNIQKFKQKVNGKKQPDSGMFSLHIDSDGKNLTDEQAAYFADSQVRDDNGALMKVYHQTGADFTRFDTGRPGAGQYDAEMPTGIFTKPTADDIGLGGQKQMELYVNITNPLRFNSRAEAVRYWERNIDGYRQARRQIENLDNEYQEKYDAADLLEDEEYKSIRQRLMNKEITREEFRARLENTETERILNEWTEKSNELRRQAKALIDEYISKSGYDGVIVENDTGSFGRRVKSIIALNSNQLKNTDNLTPTDDDDIRYSLSVQDDIRKQVWQQTAKADNIKNRAVSDFTRQVRDIFGIDNRQNTTKIFN